MWYLAFFGSAFLLAMIPGANNAVIMRQTVRSGRRGGLAALAGTETGILFWGLAAAFGLSALVTASEAIYEGLRLVGAGILIAIGIQSLWQAWRHTDDTAEPTLGGAASSGPLRSYWLGVGTLLANPKAAVFAVSFLPQFVPADANVPLTLTLLAVTWVLADASWNLMVVWLVGRVKLIFHRPAVRRRIEQVTGLVLVGLGARLMLDTR